MTALRSERDSNSQFPPTLAFGITLNTEQAENAQCKCRQSRGSKDKPCNSQWCEPGFHQPRIKCHYVRRRRIIFRNGLYPAPQLIHNLAVPHRRLNQESHTAWMFLPHWKIDRRFSMLFKGAERLRPDYSDNLSADTVVVDKCGTQRSTAEI